jgi:D-3-phosphoglycerate dehydrogenase / 2-oxoglutarate reductase
MFKVHCFNPIAQAGLNFLTENYSLVDSFREANAVLVRSASVHELELPPSLEAIARAGAGVNNIPLDKCAEQGIVVFNTPGANANGVKEIVIASLLLASRDILGGINWVSSLKDEPELAKLVERNKAKFAGTEIQGKKLGVIGLGAIGVLVANTAVKLGMEVYGFDPYISVEAAWKLSKHIKPTKSLDEIYKNCDFITVHVPLTDSTKGMFNKETFNLMKEGVNILNFARDSLVKDEDMIEALKSGKIHRYVTDFPNPTISVVHGVISIPHLGASTAESEDNCAVMAVQQVKDYLENGNIKNSVSYPDCDLGVCDDAGRIAINHKNVPNMLGQLTTVLAKEKINISDLINKSKGQWAYTLIDIDSPATQDTVAKIKEIDGVLKVRIIK